LVGDGVADAVLLGVADGVLLGVAVLLGVYDNVGVMLVYTVSVGILNVMVGMTMIDVREANRNRVAVAANAVSVAPYCVHCVSVKLTSFASLVRVNPTILVLVPAIAVNLLLTPCVAVRVCRAINVAVAGFISVIVMIGRRVGVAVGDFVSVNVGLT